MKEYPMNLQELKKEFATKKQCLDYIYKLRWPDGFYCPHCKYSEPPITVDKAKHKYKCRICWHQTSATANTLFRDTQYKLLPLWFQAIWYVTSEEKVIRALWLQKELGLGSYHTALNWVHIIRNVMGNSKNDKLKGEIIIDKCTIVNQSVLVAIEVSGAEIKRICLTRSNPSANNFAHFVRKCVASGSIIITDGNTVPDELSYKAGYILKTAHDKQKQVIEIVASISDILRHSRFRGSLQSYLHEYCFKFNKRNSESKFYEFMKIAIQVRSKVTQPYVEPHMRELHEQAYDYYMDKKLRKKILK